MGILNFLAFYYTQLFHASRFADAGIYRIINELFPIPGKVMVQEGQLFKLRLKAPHCLAKPMLACLTRLFDQF